MLDHEGKEVPGNKGYKYFGAARQLPGVRELFEQAPPLPPRKTRGELMKNIDADYYGYRDDDDGVLIPLEREAEIKAIQDAVNAWKSKKDSAMETGAEEAEEKDEEDIYAVSPSRASEPVEEEEKPLSAFTAHVPVPSQKDIEAALLRRKKQELLDRYAPD